MVDVGVVVLHTPCVVNSSFTKEDRIPNLVIFRKGEQWLQLGQECLDGQIGQPRPNSAHLATVCIQFEITQGN